MVDSVGVVDWAGAALGVPLGLAGLSVRLLKMSQSAATSAAVNIAAPPTASATCPDPKIIFCLGVSCRSTWSL